MLAVKHQKRFTNLQELYRFASAGYSQVGIGLR
jgi:hypothetical protein